MRSLLHRLAAGASVPVYAIAGTGARRGVQDLRLTDALQLVETPRAANVLLVAGGIAPEHAEALARVHDALPHPRATVQWATDAAGLKIPGSIPVDRICGPPCRDRHRRRATRRGLRLGRSAALTATGLRISEVASLGSEYVD